jgi:hypothetical protein
MGQFHLKVHIFESRLADFMLKENVNPRVELFHMFQTHCDNIDV